MSFYQVVSYPRTGGYRKPGRTFIDRSLYREWFEAENRLQELTELHIGHDVKIIVVSEYERWLK